MLDRIVIEPLYILERGKCGNQHEKGRLRKMKIGDHLIDNLKDISRENIDMRLETKSPTRMLIRLDERMCMKHAHLPIPVYLHLLGVLGFFFRRENHPEIWKTLERPTDSRPDCEDFSLGLMNLDDTREKHIRNLDHLAMNHIISDILRRNSLKSPEPDMKRHIFTRMRKSLEERISEVKRGGRRRD